MTENLYLDGNFAPVIDEVTALDLDVTGAIPSSLQGRYIRNGPNPLNASAENYHWFAGDGMLHGVELYDGRGRWYRNRYVRTPDVAAHFGESDVPRDEGGWFPGQGNTNVFHHARKIWAVTEGSLPYEITPDLETVCASNFGGRLPGGFNAHPKFDPTTGELHVVAYGFEAPYLRYHVVDDKGVLTRTEEIELGGPVMVHDLGFTSSRVVFFDLPVVFNWDLALAGEALPFRWDAGYRSRVGVMPQAGSAADTVWIDVEACYVYHVLNAYDDGDSVVMDLVVHNRVFADDKGSPLSDTSSLRRWTIDMANGTLNDSLVDDRTQEFPRADQRLTGRRHRFGYSLAAPDVATLGGIGDDPRTSVFKHDFDSGTTQTFDFGSGQIASEFVFVPASADSGEDEGWLMGYVFDATRGASDLVILDAHDLGEAPVASVHLPVRVPQGFHGNWMPDEALEL